MTLECSAFVAKNRGVWHLQERWEVRLRSTPEQKIMIETRLNDAPITWPNLAVSAIFPRDSSLVGWDSLQVAGPNTPRSSTSTRSARSTLTRIRRAIPLPRPCSARTAVRDLESSAAEKRRRLIRYLRENSGIDTLPMALCWDAWSHGLAQQGMAPSKPAYGAALAAPRVGAMEVMDETALAPITSGVGADA